MSKYLDDIFDSLAALRQEEFRLRGMANAFYRTGNKEMADQLMDVAEVMSAKTKVVQDAVATEVNRLAGIEEVKSLFDGEKSAVPRLTLLTGGKKNESVD